MDMFGVHRARLRLRQLRDRSVMSNIVPIISDLNVIKWKTLVNFKTVPPKVLQREGDEKGAGGKRKVKRTDYKKKDKDKKDG